MGMKVKKWKVNMKVKYYDLEFEFDRIGDATNMINLLSGHYVGSNDEDEIELKFSIYPVFEKEKEEEQKVED